MKTLMFILALQAGMVAFVIFFLMRYLDKALINAAIDELSSLSLPPGVQQICIYSTRSLPTMVQNEIRQVVETKFHPKEIIFEQLGELKGGIMIKIADQVLDFSLSGRLERIWS